MNSDPPARAADRPTDDPATLDPPGTIAVVGAGPLGIEAALYGRFLGYDVMLIESDAIGHSMADLREQPLPMLPDRCLSRLALQALEAQHPDRTPTQFPITIGGWIDECLVPLCDTDLLRGRLRCPARVTRIDPLAVDLTEAESASVPHDFRLTLTGVDGQSEALEAEAVVLAVGRQSGITCTFRQPTPYFFRIGERSVGDAEQDLHGGWLQIVAIYADLAGRPTLDLYRPRRL
jgi:hypothetical protein